MKLMVKIFSFVEGSQKGTAGTFYLFFIVTQREQGSPYTQPLSQKRKQTVNERGDDNIITSKTPPQKTKNADNRLDL